jgi:Zn-dependent protease with chaperone function
MLTLQKPAINYALLFLALLHVLSTGTILLVSAQLVAMAAGRTILAPSAWMVAWGILTGTASCWYTPVRSLLMHQRRPIWEESVIITGALAELEKRTGQLRTVNVWIEEGQMISASAWGRKSWTISVGALHQLTTPELAAVFAHEYGHHRCGDTHMRAAIGLCCAVHRQLMRPGKLLFRLAKRLRFVSWVAVTGTALALLLLDHYGPLVIGTALLLPCLVWSLLHKLLRPLDLWITRRNEYKQDAYAYSIGLGEPLRAALLKIAAEHSPQLISWWTVTFQYTHPIIHDRIRRLDELAGRRR